MVTDHTHVYPQKSESPSARSDTDLWNHLNQYVWGKSGAESSPAGTWSAEPFAIKPLIDINVNKIKANTERFNEVHKNLNSVGDRMDIAKTHRDSIESKFEKHLMGHNGTSNGCAFFDIPCKLKHIQNQMVMYAVIGVGAYVGIKYGVPILKKVITGRYPSGAKI